MKQIVMIGSPLDHAASPGIINPMLRAAGHDIVVVKRELTAEALDAFVAASRDDDNLVGLIVTTPLKQAICSCLDRKTAMVELLGAANCVRSDERQWLGANFDGIGFIAAICESVDSLSGRRILLIGCGGAGSAIAASLVSTADVELLIHDVDLSRAAAFAFRLQAFAPGRSIRAVAAPNGEADIIINASPIGMQPSDPCPVPIETLAHASAIADIVVRPDTTLKRQARHLGKTLIEGEAMVRGQAAFLKRFLLGKFESEAEVLAGRTASSVSLAT